MGYTKTCFGVHQPESLLFKGSQSVEQLIRNEKVGGSIPLSGTTYKSRSAQSCLGFFVALREFASKYPKRSKAVWHSPESLDTFHRAPNKHRDEPNTLFPLPISEFLNGHGSSTCVENPSAQNTQLQNRQKF